MEALLIDILNEIRALGKLDDKQLAKIIHRHNKKLVPGVRSYAKKRLLPYYLKIKYSNEELWESLKIDEVTEKLLLQILQVKPRRTASGVATITVITKPWKCSSNCLYCPNDLRMPKSYLSNEPACQRAERNYFDPYLQVVSRLRALTHMGHPTDKIELIILGGTWSDYPSDYQRWFVTELFRALNDGLDAEDKARIRRKFYKDLGLANTEKELSAYVCEQQSFVTKGFSSYNQAMSQLYERSEIWQALSLQQKASLEELESEHSRNENEKHRVVGLVVETRPDTITARNLVLLRQLGCTKIQMGIQSIDPKILKLNKRAIDLEKIREAFALLRLFGFKIHAHFMVNLYGATPDSDVNEYLRFVSDQSFIPDEVKLYPCALVDGTELHKHFADKTWRPYTEEELIEVLREDILHTPMFIRISRMIRDISAPDIVAGNKKTNLRQMVETSIKKSDAEIQEIRYREISTDDAMLDDLIFESIPYETSVSREYFLQWKTPRNKIAAFLRLSLPKAESLNNYANDIPIKAGQAMIREVHVYGKTSKLSSSGEGIQHLGLGKLLIEKACDLSREQGYHSVNVISSVGTRAYYRNLSFVDAGLYQQRSL